MKFDLIGDIHGEHGKLVALLQLLGYREQDGAWRHRDRRAVFVGDLIDRGPQQVATVTLVRAMVEAGSAHCILGNHDCLEPSNGYESTVWRTHKPPNVHVINAAGHPIEVRPGVEVVGAPWMSKRPTTDGVAEAARALDPLPHGFRVMVGHGAVNSDRVT